jgi:hypothetical protein
MDVTLKLQLEVGKVSHQLDHGHLDDSEREWLRASRRSAARRTWLLIGGLVIAAIILAWLTVDGLPGTDRAPATTTPEQRIIADGEKALADWGRFAVSNNLRDVRESFWANGPQYKQLAREAKERKGEAIGPPPYTMTMTGVQVIAPSDRADQRVLRGQVQMTRPGEEPQNFNWDVWLQRDEASDGRWRLWTVRETAGP